MEMMFVDESFCCWGRKSQGGTYLLRLKVNQPLSVRFGRFQAGEPIAVPQGDYFYVGSALAQRGATSLARRLLRHASRSDVQNPQRIRRKMLIVFSQIGLGPTPLAPPSGKKLRWHVDFLLDEPEVALTAVYLIRSSEGKPINEADDGLNRRKVGDRVLETAVARWLLSFPEVSPLVAGLGSTDDPGGTHLLRVTAVPAWWVAFPHQLTNFLQDGTA